MKHEALGEMICNLFVIYKAKLFLPLQWVRVRLGVYSVFVSGSFVCGAPCICLTITLRGESLHLLGVDRLATDLNAEGRFPSNGKR